jgi:predicted enzyme related to lactoylglutathione lyase
VTVRLYSVLIDSSDPKALAQWWSRALDWQITHVADDEVDVAAGMDADGKEVEPILTFLLVPGEKTTKNRIHIDLAPDDRDAEVERLLAMGATRADVGQGDDVSWVVLADPEGNEFCVLSAR